MYCAIISEVLQEVFSRENVEDDVKILVPGGS